MRTGRVATVTTIIALAAVTLGAVPAFTADSGSVTVTITAEASAGPCLTVTPGALDFGTLPFSASGSALSFASRNVDVVSCGSGSQTLYVAATGATGPSGTWSLSPTANVCVAGTDAFDVLVARNGSGLHLSTTPQEWVPLGSGLTAQLTLFMPCRGSSGAGEQKTFGVTFTAVA